MDAEAKIRTRYPAFNSNIGLFASSSNSRAKKTSVYNLEASRWLRVLHKEVRILERNEPCITAISGMHGSLSLLFDISVGMAHNGHNEEKSRVNQSKGLEP